MPQVLLLLLLMMMMWIIWVRASPMLCFPGSTESVVSERFFRLVELLVRKLVCNVSGRLGVQNSGADDGHIVDGLNNKMLKVKVKA